jgi:hypothetical protein
LYNLRTRARLEHHPTQVVVDSSKLNNNGG